MSKIGYSILDSIAGVVGFQEAVLIAAAYGDSKLNVPLTMTADHRIARLIGLDAAEALVANYAGMELRISKLEEYERVKNAAHAYDLRVRHGCPMFVVGEILGLSYGVVKDSLTLAERIKPTRRFSVAGVSSRTWRRQEQSDLPETAGDPATAQLPRVVKPAKTGAD